MRQLNLCAILEKFPFTQPKSDPQVG